MTILSRRAMLSGSALAIPVIAASTAARGAANATDDFSYEVTRTEAEWRERLGDDVFQIMRGGATEKPFTSDLVSEFGNGTYSCRGCDLPIYESRWKRDVDKGWVFFAQSVPNAMLMSIDQSVPDEGFEGTPEERMILDGLAAIEVHCRRCGSHIGHILIVDGQLLHCSNGTALDFQPTSA